MKKAILLFLFVLSVSASYAQELGVFARGNLSIGTQYQMIEFSSENLYYSGGGGMGLEIGVQRAVKKNLDLVASIGYQLNMALRYDIVGDDDLTSSALFNRKFLSIGIANRMDINNQSLAQIVLGAGLQYHIPGRLQRTQNDIKLDDVDYRSQLGFYLEGGMSFELSNNARINPTVRYRFVSFEAHGFAPDAQMLFDSELVEYNGNGFELGVTLIKMLK